MGSRRSLIRFLLAAAPAASGRSGCRVATAVLALATGRPGTAQPAAASAPETPESPVSRVLALAPFERIAVTVPAEVRVGIGVRESARITASRTVLDSLRLDVGEGQLTIGASRPFTTRLPILIEVECRRQVALDAASSADVTVGSIRGDLLELRARDSADLKLEGLTLASLRAELADSATVEVAGQVDTQRVRLAGSASYDARRLRSVSTDIDAGGSSEAVVDGGSRLDVAVRDAASVRYAGNPRVRQTVRDAGSVEPD